MKTKLLTICLLLFTSQVFAKQLTIYECENELDMSACNNKCKKFKHAVWEVKVNERTNKVLFDSISTHGGGLTGRSILKNKQDEEIKVPAGTMYKTYEFEIFDKDNWSYKAIDYWHLKGQSYSEIETELIIYMKNGQLFNKLESRLLAQQTKESKYKVYECSK